MSSPMQTYHRILSSLSDDEVYNAIHADRQLAGFCNETVTVSFAIQAVEHGERQSTKTFTVTKGRLGRGETSFEIVDFTLQANHADWDKYFEPVQELGYQSFWAMYLPQNQVIPAVARVTGDELKFAQYSPIWRRILEVMHIVANRHRYVQQPAPPSQPDQDAIIGRYAILDLPKWGGRCKVYYEQSGAGDRDLHTAGSDGRQYHGVMNDPRMLQKGIRMTVFDLPSHGRSFPPEDYFPGEHYNSEDRYIEVIAAIIKSLGLKRTIVCGASMAGLICIAVALRNAEVGAAATIPVQGCEFVDMERMTWDKDPRVNQSLLVPEFTYGMMSPTSPEKNRQLVWHTYSAQAYKMYAGDLDFYFGGFDYRGRLESIDTKKIPVAMLTGEYDFSCRPEMSLETAAKIKGAYIKIMEGLGHFPATEDPPKFVGYLLGAIDHVVRDD